MQKLVDICDPSNVGFFELSVGKHSSPEAGMCAMEFVAYLAGEKHSDAPQCTCPVIAAFVRRYNDCASPKDRQQLLPLLPQLIGTRGDSAIQQQRALRCADQAVRVWAPRSLRRVGLYDRASKLEALAPNAARAAAAVTGAVYAAKDAAADAEEIHTFLLELADMHREAPLEFRPAPARRCESLEKQIAEVVG